MSTLHPDALDSSQQHLQRTIQVSRQQKIFSGILKQIKQETPTVKSFDFKVLADDIDFAPGQWVDLFIPGEKIVGGFSITSTPKNLREENNLQLAVKYSEHPPSKWLHTQATLGVEVTMRIGGMFSLTEEQAEEKSLLFVAGGVGINPLFSVLLHMSETLFPKLLRERNSSAPLKQKKKRAALLYSCKTPEEFCFSSALERIEGEFPNIFQNHFTISSQQIPPSPSSSSPSSTEGKLTPEALAKEEELSSAFAEEPQKLSYRAGRITKEMLSEVLDTLEAPAPLCLLCGPPSMIDHISRLLQELQVPQENILYEKWW